ncbi:hypothetical protein VTO42DRAFT_5048 [Malbranchea cinnamomea]
MGRRMWYLPRKYVSPWTFRVLLICEFPVTVALLALFGIASPDLYRTRLWQDGADNGFNSSPQRMIYELANYRPYTTPKVWSQFITSYNLVISVLSMFFLLVKSTLFILNLFYPPFSIIVHIALVVLYSVSAAYQGGKDMSDPEHPQPGPPWYITKNCNVASDPNNIGYCQQAKSAFACTIIAIAIFAAHLVLAVISCFPTAEIRAKQQERLERHRALEELKSLKSPMYPDHGLIMTPRTTAFNQLNGTMDHPVRQASNGNSQNSSPDLKDGNAIEVVQQPVQAHTEQIPEYHQPPQPQYPPELQYLRQSQQQPPMMYFPPPPKKASKKK